MYKPVSNSILRPGSCGYFDTLGTWNPLVDLTSPSSLQKYGLSSPKEELERIPSEENAEWGPKVSRSVTEVNIDLSGGLGYVYGQITSLPPRNFDVYVRQEHWRRISLYDVMSSNVML